MLTMKPPLMPLLLSVILFIPLFAGGEARSNAKPLQYEVLRQLQPLRGDAIELGKGPVDVYVFIDPNCPHSRDFVGMIYESAKMRTLYHYYFFLYSLPHFGSSAVINAIYADASPREAMLSYMVGHKPLPKLSRLTPPAVQAKVARIANTAKAIGVDKRPYLILDKKKKP
jgi:hypothetical protein